MSIDLRVANAGVTSCNGDYALINDLKTGTDRIWMLDERYRVYYRDGWRLANADITTVYYKLMMTVEVNGEVIVGSSGIGVENPWDTENAVWVATQESHGALPVINPVEVDNTIVETYTEMEGEQEVEVRKITNLVTGYVRYERTVHKVEYDHQISVHDRYTAPMLTLGRVYQFQFVSDFAILGYQPDVEDSDPLAGIYRVDRMISYFDLTVTGIDLYKSLYEPLGLSYELYDKDFDKLGDMMVYKLTDVRDESSNVYMPLMFIEGTPNSSINQYDKVMLSIDIGAQFDKDLLKSVRDTLSSVLKAKWGITSSTNLGVYDKVWMPEDHYASLVEDRDELKKEIYRTQGNVLADTLFYVEENLLFKKYRSILEKLALYEEIIESQ